ncbi:MAG: AAA family ATPase, partial [Thermodesulfobacteriota bacterium]
MNKSNDNLRDLELLIRSHYSIIFMESAEDERTETLLKLLASRLRIPYFFWTRTKGLSRGDVESKGPVYGTTDLSLALKHIEAAGFQAIYHLKDAGDLLEDKTASEMLKDAAAPYTRNYGAIVITGQNLKIPDSVKQSSAFFELTGPGRDEYKQLLGRVTSDLRSRIKADVRLSGEDTNRLLNNLKGLTLTEAEKIITRIIVEDGTLDPEDIGKVIEAKKEIVERDGVLEYYPAEEGMSDIADLRTLKSWLSKRKETFADPEKAATFGLSFPKGVLLLGVPGCGKSLSAKAVAKEWGLPLLKMDPSSLYNKYIGESEKNFRRAMETAEKMSPVVLWIDEIEKAFSAGGETEDGGVSARIFGTFLSWLQERSGDVFIA